MKIKIAELSEVGMIKSLLQVQFNLLPICSNFNLHYEAIDIL